VLESQFGQISQQHAGRANVLFSGRILPVPAVTRNALVDEFCLHEPLKERAKADKANHDCLIRIHLGRRRKTRTSGAPQHLWFALRNFKMDLQCLEALGIRTTQYARSMAIALAVMHWQSKFDARDVEFDLGGRPAETHYIKRDATELESNSASSTAVPN
jgi:hypothetical protein